MSTTSDRTRVPAGVPTGGEFAATTHAESGVSLADPDAAGPEDAGTADPGPGSVVEADTVFTRRYPSVEDKIAAFQAELDQGVADLDHDENWQHYLSTIARFHRYSSGRRGIFELLE